MWSLLSWATPLRYSCALPRSGSRILPVGVQPSDENIRRFFEDRSSQSHRLTLQSLAALIDTAVDSHGRIDILVNNLGGSRNAKIWEMPVADFDFVLRLNLRSTFLCTRAAAAYMMKRRQGRIICMSSGAREGTPWTAYYQGGAAYSAAKAGVHGFIRDVALELAEYNITVNAVAPGPIDTERTGPSLKRLDATVERSPSRMTPLGRLGTVEEVAAAALFLASDEASYVSGHTLHVAGGR